MDLIIKDSEIKDNIALMMDSRPYHLDADIFTKEEVKYMQHEFEQAMFKTIQKFDEKRQSVLNDKLVRIKKDKICKDTSERFRNITSLPSIGYSTLFKNELTKILESQDWSDIEKQYIHNVYVEELFNHSFNLGFRESKPLIEKKMIIDSKLIGSICCRDIEQTMNINLVDVCNKLKWYLNYTSNIDCPIFYESMQERIIDDIDDEEFDGAYTDIKLYNDVKGNNKLKLTNVQYQHMVTRFKLDTEFCELLDSCTSIC